MRAALPWPVLVFLSPLFPGFVVSSSSCRELEMADVEAQIHNVPSPRHQSVLASSTTANAQFPERLHGEASLLAATTPNPQTTYHIHPRPPNSAFFQSQVSGTNDPSHGNVPPLVHPFQIAGVQGMLTCVHKFTTRTLFSSTFQVRSMGTLPMQSGPCTSLRPRSKIRMKSKVGKETRTGSSYL